MSSHPDNLRTCGVAVVAALLLLVTGCQNAAPGRTAVVGEPASSTASPEPGPLSGAPALGTCYQMTRSAARAVSNDDSGVSCSAPHTSMTYHVGHFPADMVDGDTQVAFRGCTGNLPKGVGLTSKEVQSSILTWIWFEPTTAEWSAGARWYRCDVIAQQGNGALKPLPSGPPYFANGVPDDYFRCIRERGGVGVPVTCDRSHGYRWAGTFEGTGRRLPSEARLLA
jgi:Septum formation